MNSILDHFSGVNNFVFLNGNDQVAIQGVECLLAIDEAPFLQKQGKSYIPLVGKGLPLVDWKGWKFGFIGYDYKNRLEHLRSENPDIFGLPDIYFMNPIGVYAKTAGKWKVLYGEEEIQKQSFLDTLQHVNLDMDSDRPRKEPLLLRKRMSKTEYLIRVREIQDRIRRGEVYELNFCQEFYAEEADLDPLLVFQKLNRISPSPFSAFCRFGSTYLICSSPERFLKKVGSRLVSQPIKGTRPRGQTTEEDSRLRKELKEDDKERAENVMIVDLVRNDLSRIAEKGSVKVDELQGIYSFEQVHQMISTISCEVKPDVTFEEIIRATFPMGSMTGAPKIRAMQLIEEYESSRRGLYSGALGFINPEGDFDFSVVIRSILYDARKKHLSFHVGSAITAKSDPEKEYEECLVKAKALVEALNGMIVD
jgi:para-aminobenzoate synthetase component 1